MAQLAGIMAGSLMARLSRCGFGAGSPAGWSPSAARERLPPGQVPTKSDLLPPVFAAVVAAIRPSSASCAFKVLFSPSNLLFAVSNLLTWSCRLPLAPTSATSERR